MPENKHLRLLVLLYIALGALGLWLTARFLVPWLLPFLIAWALAPCWSRRYACAWMGSICPAGPPPPCAPCC